MPVDGEGTVEGRRLSGVFGKIESIICLCIPVSAILFVLGVQDSFRLFFYKEQFLALFLGLAMSAVFLGVPATKAGKKRHLPWYDVILSVLSLAICLYFASYYTEYIITSLSGVGTLQLILGTILILLVMETTRRMTGWILVIMLVVFMLYASFASMFPGALGGKNIPFKHLIPYMTLDGAALFGLPVWVTASIVFGFIIFGEFLLATGGSQLINDFTLAIMGRYRGGPAKVSVVASSLFGTISGSVVANISAVGVVTIPMMKSTGYKASMAAAIESVASTGGQIMPPVMGITAFLIAEFLSIPYAQVAIAAAVPAILYYLVLFIQVDMEAGKMGLKGVTGALPRIFPIVKKSWIFFFPAVILIYFLFFLNFEPGRAAIWATVSIIIFSMFTKKTRIGLFKFVKLLIQSGRGLLMMAVIAGIAGLVIGVIYITGVGTTLSNYLLELGGQNLLVMLLITAALCIIMGMGLPTTAIYVILAVLVAPALVKLGIPALAAHFFIFYMGTSSFITPPIALGAFAAGAIARADPMIVALYACRIGIVVFLVPFAFVYSPAILLIGSVQEIILVIAKCTFGLGILAIALSGFLFRDLRWGKRILLLLGAIAMLIPFNSGMQYALLLNLIGIAVSIVIILWEWLRHRTTSIAQPAGLVTGQK